MLCRWLPSVQEAAETGMGPAPQQQQQGQGQQAEEDEEEDALGVIERETSRLRVVHRVPRTSLELRRHSALGDAGGGSGHLHAV